MRTRTPSVRARAAVAVVAGIATALTAAAVPAAQATSPAQPPPTEDALPAFPGAEGFGYASAGGRGGEVYHVTSRELTGPGTFHDALTTAGDAPRTIVFEISGDIEIPQIVVRDKHRITIAGQTAPGDGVTIRGNTVRFVDSSDVVIRHMRFRLGSASTDDAMYLEDCQNVIIDHSSFSWAGDEVLSIKSKDYESPQSKNITVQWSIMSEGRLTHSMGGLVEMNTISMHHNLYAHNNDRNPKTKGVMDFVNNVVYNWGDYPYVAGGESATQGYGNVVGNYFVAGANSQNPTAAVVRGNENYQVFLDDNRVDADKDGVLDGKDTGAAMLEAERPAVQVDERFAYPPVHTQAPRRALDLTLDHAGASVQRDAVDQRVVDDVRNQTGAIIGHESDVGGYPELEQGTAGEDTDRDGMRDAWESERGLDPADPQDRNGDDDGDRYTNLEEYLNELAAPGLPQGYPTEPVPWSGDGFEPPAPETPEPKPGAPMNGESIRSAVVTDTSGSGTDNAALWSIQQDLQPGDFVAGDRMTGSKAYRFTSMPAEIRGTEWVRSAVASRAATNDDVLSFYLPVDADVYVAHDTRISPRPDWLADGYEATGDTVTDDHGGEWDVFKARFPAGSHVVTGANAGGTVLNYFVAVDPVPGQSEPVGDAPSALVAQADETAGVSLTWDASPGASAYLVERSSPAEPEMRVVGTADAATYRDEDVEPGVPYRYRVTAVGAGGASGPSDVTRALVTSEAAPAPAPGDVEVTTERSYSVDLAWPAVDDATAYGVYRAPAAGGDLELLDHVEATDDPAYTDDAVEPSSAYRYAVTTLSAGGESGRSAGVEATTAGPLDPATAPQGLRTADVTPSRFALAWEPVDQAESYQVYRRDGDGAFALVGTTDGPTYVDDTVSASVASYDYAVAAVNELGESARSTPVTVPLPVPEPPSDLRVGLQGATFTGLIWDATGGATEYRVLRAAPGGEPQEVGTAKVRTFYDRTAEPDTAYTYRVVAVNAAGDSEPSAAVDTRTPPPSP